MQPIRVTETYCLEGIYFEVIHDSTHGRVIIDEVWKQNANGVHEVCTLERMYCGESDLETKMKLIANKYNMGAQYCMEITLRQALRQCDKCHYNTNTYDDTVACARECGCYVTKYIAENC